MPAKTQLEATQKLIRRLAFEAAIASADEKLTSARVSPTSLLLTEVRFFLPTLLHRFENNSTKAVRL